MRFNRRFTLRGFALAEVIVLLSVCGCGARDKLTMAPVHGTVTYRGKLLDRGKVVFLPEQGPPAVGHIQPDGSYKLTTARNTGALVGRHRVLVHLRRLLTKAEERQMGVMPESIIPEKYSRDDLSPLRFDVKPGMNEYVISLK